MADSPATRTRKPSARSLIAVTGAAAMAVTLAHATATQATSSSTVSSDAQVSTGNYYPTPLTAEVRCRTNPSGNPVWNRRAEVSWDAVEGATGYRVEIVDSGSDEPWIVREVNAGTTSVSGLSAVENRSATANQYEMYARVRTINGPSVSTGYTVGDVGIYHDWWWTTDRTECDGPSGSNSPNQPWEDTHEWDPNTAAPAGTQSGRTELRSARASDEEVAEETDSPTDTSAATSTDTSTSASTPTTSETTTKRTTSPSTSTSSPSSPLRTSSPGTSTTPGTSTPPVLPETPRQVKPQLTRTTTAPSGTVTAGMTADGRVALVDGEGIQLVDGQVDSAVELQWQSGVDILWIVGPDQVHRIMKSADGTWKFYLDSGQNLPAGIG